MRDLATAIRRYTVAPETDLQYALTAAIANVCLGNGDAHGKNFALLTTADGDHRLAPFYDIVSTDVYPALTPTFSMTFGHAERDVGAESPVLHRLRALVRARTTQVEALLVRG